MDQARGMKVWEFLLLLLGLVLIAGMLLVVVNFTVLPRIVHRHTVIVAPDLQGLSVAEAGESVAARQMTVTETRQRPHPTVAAGLILEQSPAAGTPIRSGRGIRVITSSGPPTGGVPELVGLNFRQAEITLQRENYSLGRVVRLAQENVSTPTVLFQQPPAGRDWRKGRAVDLVIGEPAPPRLLAMPDLRGVPLYLARQRVAAAGCVLAPVVYERTDEREANVILRQQPAPGLRIRKGDRIELVASSP
ncbi:MAG: PASTA domain-containing protein [Candidatus Krumholzibacteria bacterium]|jgi:serine/threonine-protein kinase|nr:PASTA domain-containing protein [Candidatus Krumholzibacteria bacterium]